MSESDNADILQRFTRSAIQVVHLAREEARRFRGSTVGTEHILLGLVREQEGLAAKVLERMGVSHGRVQNIIRQQLNPTEIRTISGSNRTWTPRARRILELALEEARDLNPKLGLAQYVDTEHLLLGLLRETDCSAIRVLRALNVDIEQIRQQVVRAMGGGATSQSGTQKGRSATPVLDAFGRDLTRMAVEDKLDPVIGRQTELQRIIQILSRRTKNNPVLIGEPGVGKTAIVEGLAQRITRREVPDALFEKRVVSLDLAGLVAGTKYRGEFEERMKRVMEEIRKGAGEIILFIDELHTLIGAGAAEGAIDASNILKPALSRGELQCIGATTLNEYRKYIEKDPALERRFQSVLVGEPTTDQTVEILKGLRPRYEAHHQVKITDSALISAARLSERYITDRFLPDKAIDVMDEAASRVRLHFAVPPQEVRDVREELQEISKELASFAEPNFLERDWERGTEIRTRQRELQARLEESEGRWEETRAGSRVVVDEEDIAQVVSLWTGVPVSRLAEAETQKLLNMEDALHRRIVGQDEAVTAISRAVRRGRAGLKDPRRPIGSFIFLGPTGVGKTELARALAEFMFDSEDAMVRIDMSEYMERFAVSRLVGAPPGYVGYEEGGQLTEAVRRRPYCVVLLDEIEKAHPEVFNILLQVMEDGRLTDSQARVVDFRNTVIIMTSNIGTTSFDPGRAIGYQMSAGSGNEEAMAHDRMRTQILDKLKQSFRPEFINRIDEVIVFHALSLEQMKSIVHLLLDRVASQIKGQGMSLEVSQEVMELLVSEGFDRALGARPLRRAIQRLVEDPLSEQLLHGNFVEGDTINAEVEEGHIVFRKQNQLSPILN
jgi:ATP-dependent Clp protease ATP-binding subunit ClpC